MSYISTYPKKNSNILRLLFEIDIIEFNPDYQRNGDIWSLDKRQLLIDSILNDYDIPKLYFHVLSYEKKNKTGKEFAIIDGRQRIETIISFVNGDFSLAKDFKYLRDVKVKAGGFYYKDLAEIYPKLKMSFDSFDLPIINVETDTDELIDDMFLRLNEAVPLNAAEKRNAIGGPLVNSIKKIAKNIFFEQKIKFTNNRYQYLEVSIRLLFIEHFMSSEGKIYDTKKLFLDALVEKYKSDVKLNVKLVEENVLLILSKMSEVFADADPLLGSQGIITIYYLIFREIYIEKKLKEITRIDFLNFKNEVKKNKELAELDIREANYDLIDFDRMSVQGTNDASSIKERFRIMSEYFKKN